MGPQGRQGRADALLKLPRFSVAHVSGSTLSPTLGSTLSLRDTHSLEDLTPTTNEHPGSVLCIEVTYDYTLYGFQKHYLKVK